MSVQEPDSAFSFESLINNYLNNAVHSQDTSEEERACIVKIQWYLLETLQEAGEAGVCDKLQQLWGIVFTAVLGITRIHPDSQRHWEYTGEKKLHALAMLPFRPGDSAESFQVGVGSEDAYECLLHKGPDKADTAMISWMSLNFFLSSAYGASCSFAEGDIEFPTTALVFVLALEEQRPLAARGASAGEALESWVPAVAMWMSNNGFRVADEVCKNELFMKTDGPPPGPLAKKKGIKSTDITLKRWKFWKDLFQKVWDLSIEYDHGPNAHPNGRSLIETGLAAKEGIEAMEKAESLYGPGGELADPESKSKTCCAILGRNIVI